MIPEEKIDWESHYKNLRKQFERMNQGCNKTEINLALQVILKFIERDRDKEFSSTPGRLACEALDIVNALIKEAEKRDAEKIAGASAEINQP